jgi:heme exporter protein C
MLRFSVEPGERRATYSAVYTLLGVGLLPISVLAVRLSQELIHPITFNSNGVNMDGSMFLTFCVSLAAMLSLAATMYFVEMRGKRLDERIRRLRSLAGSSA